MTSHAQELLTVSQVAEELGVSEPRVLVMLLRGHLHPAAGSFGSVRVERSQLQRFLGERDSDSEPA